MIIWLIVGIWIQFNMLFNYTMCVIVKAGNPNDIHHSHISHIEYKCKKCNSIKPPRTHHCSMCQ
jgi:palmitoyltransferase